MAVTVPGIAGESRSAFGCESGSDRKRVAVLLVDADRSRRRQIGQVLSPACALVKMAESLAEADALYQRGLFDLYIISVGRNCPLVLEWLQKLADAGAHSNVVLTTDYADLETVLKALRAGASDLLIRPYRDDELLSAVERCLHRQRQMRQNFLLRRREATRPAEGGLIGRSRAMRNLTSIVDRVAPTNSTILLQGETGTGKELIAREIHRHSGRRGKFVPVNCSAITPDLLDSELFGHTRGAFTGAHVAREGLFASADDGTVFLDEIGEMPLEMQANLLRVLEDRHIRPVGCNQELPINCRIIAATNVCLEQRVKQGRFREDLHYRLHVLPITAPPLRERVEDIPYLLTHFIQTLSPKLGATPLRFDGQVVKRLQSYHWPGNVRELRNLVERALLLDQPLLDCLDWGRDHDNPQYQALHQTEVFPETLSLSEVNKRHMLSVLDSVGGNKSEAARRLCISRKTLERKLSAWRHEN